MISKNELRQCFPNCQVRAVRIHQVEKGSRSESRECRKIESLTPYSDHTLLFLPPYVLPGCRYGSNPQSPSSQNLVQPSSSQGQSTSTSILGTWETFSGYGMLHTSYFLPPWPPLHHCASTVSHRSAGRRGGTYRTYYITVLLFARQALRNAKQACRKAWKGTLRSIRRKGCPLTGPFKWCGD